LTSGYAPLGEVASAGDRLDAGSDLLVGEDARSDIRPDAHRRLCKIRTLAPMTAPAGVGRTDVVAQAIAPTLQRYLVEPLST
jgi:hypothetical protein